MPRKAGYRHNDETRRKIQAAQLINRLEKHVFAKTPILNASQVNAAKALLAKVLPDLTAQADTGEQGELTNAYKLGAERFTRAIASLASRNTEDEAPRNPGRPN